MKTNNSKEVGGNHYERFEIEPVHIMVEFNLNWFQGEALKYISRHWFKGMDRDLDKAIHVMDMAGTIHPFTFYYEPGSKLFDLNSLFHRYINQFYQSGLVSKSMVENEGEPDIWFISVYHIVNGDYNKASEYIHKYKERFYGKA